jgi:rod shape determining protein RodA
MARAHNGATAWFTIAGFEIQPSEYAKVTVIIVLAAYLANPRGLEVDFAHVVRAIILVAIPMGLTLLQPDLGTASVIAAIALGVLVVAGVKARHLALISLLGLVTIGVIVGTGQLDRYQQARLTTFINQGTDKVSKDAALQVEQSKTAIGLGGLTGSGFRNGTMTNGGFVPENHTDFIFTVVAEEGGFAAAAGLLALYAFIGFRMLRTAQMARDLMGALIATGALVLLAWHVFQNVGMTMGIMPVTGIPLPLLSYGGSSSVAFLCIIGLVESVHMRRYA